MAGKPIPGDLRNLSAGGLCFHCRAPVTLSDEITLRFRLMPDRVCTARGEVVRYGTEKDYGIEFAETNDDLTEFLTDLLKLREDLHDDFIGQIMEPSLVIASA